MQCWQVVMRQSGISSWSRQKMLWHNCWTDWGLKELQRPKQLQFLLTQAAVNTNEHRGHFCCHNTSINIDKEPTYFPWVKNNRQGVQIIWFYTTEGLWIFATWIIYSCKLDMSKGQGPIGCIFFYVDCGAPRGHFITFDLLKEHPMRHLITFYSQEGHPKEGILSCLIYHRGIHEGNLTFSFFFNFSNALAPGQLSLFLNFVK